MLKLLHFIRVMTWHATHNPDFQELNFFYGLELGTRYTEDGLEFWVFRIPLNYSGWFPSLEWDYLKTKDLSEAERLEWFDRPPF